MVATFIHKVLPEVDKELIHWKGVCERAEDSILSEQALASIRFKRFHAQGGSVYSLYPNTNLPRTVKFIVALQTISDYLDNLCDRAGVFDEAAFRQLHLSMLDAVDPMRPAADYYSFYPYKRDNGYLSGLVDECRQQLCDLPSYRLVLGMISKYIGLYSDLQVYKHLALDKREARLTSWANSFLPCYPGITCWEFAAATGSTLGVFTLYSAAFDSSLTKEEVQLIDKAYFPWACGLHILLDYYIDQQEDSQMGDLNFTGYYENLKHCEERLTFFIEKALEKCFELRYPKFHATVIYGLLAMYLSDPKALGGLNRLSSMNLIKRGGAETRFYHSLCKWLRSRGTL